MASPVKTQVGQAPIPFEDPSLGFRLTVESAGRTSFNRLLDRISDSPYLQQLMGSIALDDLAIIDPIEIETALLVRGTPRTKIDNAYHGLVFPAADFAAIVRNPSAVVASPKARTESVRSRIGQSDQKVQAAKARTAGYTLEGYISGMATRQAILSSELATVNVVLGELKAPHRAHYGAGSLLVKVTSTKDYIDQMIEVAGRRLGWSEADHALAKKASGVKLLGLHRDGNQRNANWRIYGNSVRKYNRRRSGTMAGSQRAAGLELHKYKPHLDNRR